MQIDFGRGVCGEFSAASSREWLVTNGIGGFASGTISGVLTRRYHGFLVAALQPPLGRTLMVSKIDETAHYLDTAYPLYTNSWSDGALEPEGFKRIERFHLEGTTPVWSYTFADALLEKRVWMQPGANTTTVSYHLSRSRAPVTLTAKVLVNYRDFHGATRDHWQMHIDPLPAGLRLTAFPGATPFYILSQEGKIIPRHEWFTGFALSVEHYRGFEGMEDHLYAAQVQITLTPGERAALVLSSEPAPNLDSVQAYKERTAYEKSLLEAFRQVHGGRASSAAGRSNPGQKIQSNQNTSPLNPVEQLALAADQFIVRRPVPENPGQAEQPGYSVIAGYPWFGDWGRDTMISLPGLTLATGRPEVAHSILRTYARFIHKGMLPNRFPDSGEEPEYNTVDATLWYIEAIRAYHAATGDDKLLGELFPRLKEIVDWHQRGACFQIQADPGDGLLYAGVKGVQLTWMDAKVGNYVVTPRIGKAVEINALWYNALRIIAEFARRLGEPAALYDRLADKAETGFSSFWYTGGDYCYDVIHGPDGDDSTLRPNQILAVSLPHSPLPYDQQKAVVDACGQYLLTSHGMRSLDPRHPDYAGYYGGDVGERDRAYHQGTVWSWLMGPFVSAHLRVYKDHRQARTFLEPLFHHLANHGLGSISEIFDGNPPFTPRGCIAQAWGVAEVLRAWKETHQ